MPAQDRDLPAGDGASEPLELGHVAGRAVVVEDDEALAGLERVGCCQALATELLGQVGGADLTVGIPSVEVIEDAAETGRPRRS